MVISSGEGPSSSNNSRIRKRPRTTICYGSRESEEQVPEAQGGRTVDEDQESNAGEGSEWQNEEAEEEAAEDADAEEEREEEVYEVINVDESFSGEEVASGGDSVGSGARDGSISVTLTDPDIFNCSICYELLSFPVFQCENGHIACSACCVQLAHKCHLCRAPIGHIRCLAIEKVMESIKIPCCYARHGCVEKITHINKRIHEKECIYTPCRCPIDGCQFTAPRKKLFHHINHEHLGSYMNFYYNSYAYVTLGINQKVLVLQAIKDSNIFIITNDLDHLGNVIKVFHVGPKSSAENYMCKLCVSARESCLILDSFVNHTLGDNFPPTTKFLLVPDGFLGLSPELEITIRISKV